MVANLETLSEVVDLTRIDRKLADKIQADLERINKEIETHGYSDITMDGKTFRVKRALAEKPAA